VNKEIPSMDRNEETGTFTPGRRQFLGVAGAAALAVGATQFLLAAAGYRVIAPYFRGYGTTTFRSRKTPRDPPWSPPVAT
jgi:pimeloyl-ACP methyl ester carboxylesterase